MRVALRSCLPLLRKSGNNGYKETNGNLHDALTGLASVCGLPQSQCQETNLIHPKFRSEYLGTMGAREPMVTLKMLRWY